VDEPGVVCCVHLGLVGQALQQEGQQGGCQQSYSRRLSDGDRLPWGTAIHWHRGSSIARVAGWAAGAAAAALSPTLRRCLFRCVRPTKVSPSRKRMGPSTRLASRASSSSAERQQGGQGVPGGAGGVSVSPGVPHILPRAVTTAQYWTQGVLRCTALRRANQSCIQSSGG
jgi:hypothetical protein